MRTFQLGINGCIMPRLGAYIRDTIRTDKIPFRHCKRGTAEEPGCQILDSSK